MMTTARIYKTSIALLTLLTLLLAACGGDDKKATEKATGPIPFKVIKAETRDVPIWSEQVAQITAKKTVEVRARVEGFLETREFKEGDAVKTGQLLFTIDPKTYQEQYKQAQAQVDYNKALIAKAEKDYKRFKKLFEENVVSSDEFESYATDLQTKKASLADTQAAADDARIKLGYTKIYSPMDGIIGRTDVDLGNLVGRNENTLLATISSIDPVYASVNISETLYLQSQRNKAERLRNGNEPGTIKMVLADDSDYDHSGKLDMIDRAVDPRTGTLGIRLEFPNPTGLLRPGQYAKIRALVKTKKDAVVIPARAVMDTQGMKSVYVVGEDGKVEGRPVKLGTLQSDIVVINEGLKPGEMVIADGIRKIRPGMELKPIVVPMDGDSQSQTEPQSAEAADKEN